MIKIEIIKSDIHRNEYTEYTETENMNEIYRALKSGFMPLSHIYIDNKPIRSYERFAKGVSRQELFAMICDWVYDGIDAAILINDTAIASAPCASSVSDI